MDAPILLAMIYILLTLYDHEIQLLSLILIAFSAFVSWAIGVNIYYYMDSYNPFYIKASLQLSYVMMLFLIFTILFFRILNKNVIPYMYTALLLAIITPLFIKGKTEAGFMARQALSFNNPNQIALYALSIMAITLVLNNYFTFLSRREKILSLFVYTVVFILGHYFIVLSASRGGLISLVLIDMIAIWKTKKKSLFAVLMPVIFVAFIFLPDRVISQYNLSEMRAVKRLVNADLSALLAKRTEGRFVFQDISIIFGRGKTNTTIGKKEVHNTLGDILYSYGVIGICLFSIFLVFYLKHCICVSYNILILLAFVPMNISHNLFRFRTIWILLALVYSIGLIRGNSYPPERDNSCIEADLQWDMEYHPNPGAPAVNKAVSLPKNWPAQRMGGNIVKHCLP